MYGSVGGRERRRARPTHTATSAALLTILSLLAACEPDVSLVVPRPAQGEPSLRVTVRLEDPDLAAALAWEDGVPDADFWLIRQEDPPARELRSDSAGQVEVMELIGGTYWIWAQRRLSEAERAALGERDVRVFGGGDKISVASRELDELELLLATEDPGSLVLTEFAMALPSSLGPQDGSRFIRVANDSQETVYLDGHILGAGFIYPIDSPNWPCPVYEQFRSDPGALYASHVLAFPGLGHEYPLAPGASVVIAVQAIDHTEVRPGEGYLDLRGADFQLPSSIRNPNVPVMVDVGLYAPTGGWDRIFPLDLQPFLARPVDIDGLERRLDPHNRYRLRFPMELVLDLATLIHPIRFYHPSNPLCPRMLPPETDRLEGMFGTYPGPPDANQFSVQRKTVPGGGRHQRTGTTMADFFRGPVTFGTVP